MHELDENIVKNLKALIEKIENGELGIIGAYEQSEDVIRQEMDSDGWKTRYTKTRLTIHHEETERKKTSQL